MQIPCNTTPNLCTPGIWPASNLGAFYEPSAPADHQAWFGSLTTGKTDASGFMYMRNRYYNPQTGTFTQPDPIGIAGGLNVYGFAAGDPVTYNDPYGLCPPCAVAVAAAVETVPEWGPPLIVALSATSVVAGHKAITDYVSDHPEMLMDIPAIAHSGPAQSDGTSWVRRTAPVLPPREIVREGGVVILHHYRENDHGYAHVHVQGGGGPDTRIGQNGKPYRNDAPPTPQQQRVIDNNQSTIRRAVRKIGRWLQFQEGG